MSARAAELGRFCAALAVLCALAPSARADGAPARALASRVDAAVKAAVASANAASQGTYSPADRANLPASLKAIMEDTAALRGLDPRLDAGEPPGLTRLAATAKSAATAETAFAAAAPIGGKKEETAAAARPLLDAVGGVALAYEAWRSTLPPAAADALWPTARGGGPAVDAGLAKTGADLVSSAGDASRSAGTLNRMFGGGLGVDDGVAGPGVGGGSPAAAGGAAPVAAAPRSVRGRSVPASMESSVKPLGPSQGLSLEALERCEGILTTASRVPGAGTVLPRAAGCPYPDASTASMAALRREKGLLRAGLAAREWLAANAADPRNRDLLSALDAALALASPRRQVAIGALLGRLDQAMAASETGTAEASLRARYPGGMDADGVAALAALEKADPEYFRARVAALGCRSEAASALAVARPGTVYHPQELGIGAPTLVVKTTRLGVPGLEWGPKGRRVFRSLDGSVNLRQTPGAGWIAHGRDAGGRTIMTALDDANGAPGAVRSTLAFQPLGKGRFLAFDPRNPWPRQIGRFDGARGWKADTILSENGAVLEAVGDEAPGLWISREAPGAEANSWSFESSALSGLSEGQRQARLLKMLTWWGGQRGSAGPEGEYEARTAAAFFGDFFRRREEEKVSVILGRDGRLTIRESKEGRPGRRLLGVFEPAASGLGDDLRPAFGRGLTVYACTPTGGDAAAGGKGKSGACEQPGEWHRSTQYFGERWRDVIADSINANFDDGATPWWSGAKMTTATVARRLRRRRGDDGAVVWTEEKVVPLGTRTEKIGPGILGATMGAVGTVGEGVTDLFAAGVALQMAIVPGYAELVGVVSGLNGGDADPGRIREDLFDRARTDFFNNAVSREVGDNLFGDANANARAGLVTDSLYVQNVGAEVGGPMGAVLQGGVKFANNLTPMLAMGAGGQAVAGMGAAGKVAVGGSALFFSASGGWHFGTAVDRYLDAGSPDEKNAALTNLTEQSLNLPMLLGIGIKSLQPRAPAAGGAPLPSLGETPLPGLKALDYTPRWLSRGTRWSSGKIGSFTGLADAPLGRLLDSGFLNPKWAGAGPGRWFAGQLDIPTNLDSRAIAAGDGLVAKGMSGFRDAAVRSPDGVDARYGVVDAISAYGNARGSFKGKPAPEVTVSDLSAAQRRGTLFRGADEWQLQTGNECTVAALANGLSTPGRAVTTGEIFGILAADPRFGPGFVAKVQRAGLERGEFLDMYRAVAERYAGSIEVVPSDKFFANIAERRAGLMASVENGFGRHQVFVEGLVTKNGVVYVSVLDSNFGGRTFMTQAEFASIVRSGGVRVRPGVARAGPAFAVKPTEPGGRPTTGAGTAAEAPVESDAGFNAFLRRETGTDAAGLKRMGAPPSQIKSLHERYSAGLARSAVPAASEAAGLSEPAALANRFFAERAAAGGKGSPAADYRSFLERHGIAPGSETARALGAEIQARRGVLSRMEGKRGDIDRAFVGELESGRVLEGEFYRGMSVEEFQLWRKYKGLPGETRYKFVGRDASVIRGQYAKAGNGTVLVKIKGKAVAYAPGAKEGEALLFAVDSFELVK